jgi:hypothetical protein
MGEKNLLFADALISRLPSLPIEEEGQHIAGYLQIAATPTRVANRWK